MKKSAPARMLQGVVGLLRVQSYIIISLQLVMAVAVSSYVSGDSFSSVVSGNAFALLFGFLCVAVWYINATSVNDLADFEIDKINLKGDKERPLVAGQMDKRAVRTVALSSAAVGLLAAALIAPVAAVVMAAFLVLNWTYSMPPVRISYRGGWAPALLPLGYAGLPFLLGVIAVSGQSHATVWLVLASLYALFCSRVLLKDFRDVVGDKKHGKLTFLLRHSVTTVVRTAIAMYVLGVSVICVLILDTQVPNVAVPVLFLGGINLVLFSELAKTKHWKEQKPFLAPIGRINSAQLVLLLLALIAENEAMPSTQVVTISLALTMSFTWSAYISLRQHFPGQPR